MAAPTGRRRCCSAGCCAAGAAAVRLSLGSSACLPACQPQLPPLDLSCRWLWDAFTRPKWSPATHRQHPEAFRQAVRAFLLAAHRSASGGQRR
jgi:hypothetical protein